MDVRMPDGTVIRNVPEGTTKSELQRKLGALKASKREQGIAVAQGAVQQARQERLGEEPAPQGSQFHAPGAMGLAADLGLNMARNGIASAAGGLAGIGSTIFNRGGDHQGVIDRVSGAIGGEPFTAEGQAASRAMNKPFEWLARGADLAGGATAEATDSPLLGAGVNTAIQVAPTLILRGRGTSNPGAGVAGRSSRQTPPAAVPGRTPGLGRVPPTIEELGAQSKAAYKRASDAKANIAPASFDGLKTRLKANLEKEGLDPTLHPETTAALKRITETEGAVTLDQLETLRKIASDARGTVKKPDSRLAGQVVDEIDDFMANVGQKDITTGSLEGFAALKEARNLYSRKAKAEEIARLVKRAEDSAPNFTASGYENALRIQFRQLAMNDKRMRRFNAEEQAAIRKVARGGPLENSLRMIGKMAPTGVISGAFGIGAASMLPGGAILPAAGLAGRYAATRMTAKNARLAEETMRRGPQRPRSALQEAQEEAARRLVEETN